MFLSDETIVELDKTTGKITGKKEGTTLVTYIFEGKKYGAFITVAGEAKPKRTRKKKDEEGL